MFITGQTHCDPCWRHKQGFIIVPEYRTLCCVTKAHSPELENHNGPNMATFNVCGLNHTLIVVSYRNVGTQFPMGTGTTQAAVLLKAHPNMELMKPGGLEMSVELVCSPTAQFPYLHWLYNLTETGALWI